MALKLRFHNQKQTYTPSEVTEETPISRLEFAFDCPYCEEQQYYYSRTPVEQNKMHECTSCGKKIEITDDEYEEFSAYNLRSLDDKLKKSHLVKNFAETKHIPWMHRIFTLKENYFIYHIVIASVFIFSLNAYWFLYARPQGVLTTTVIHPAISAVGILGILGYFFIPFAFKKRLMNYAITNSSVKTVLTAEDFLNNKKIYMYHYLPPEEQDVEETVDTEKETIQRLQPEANSGNTLPEVHKED